MTPATGGCDVGIVVDEAAVSMSGERPQPEVRDGAGLLGGGEEIGNGISRERDIFRVFVSFSSRNNLDGEVSEFVRDLEKRFRELSGFKTEDYSVYLSHDQDRQGANWPDELNRELNRADVLMPVMSPDFFRSKWCAQEWGAFEERLALLPDIEMPERIIPVVWFQEELPPAARGLRIGWGPTKVPDYREMGLSLLREEDPKQYRTAVRLLAKQLKELVEDGDRLPHVDPPINVPSAALAFPERQANTPCAAWRYYLVHASVSADELAALEAGAVTSRDSPSKPEPRNPRHYYGRSSDQWDPFRQDGDPRPESRVRRAIEDETWSHRMRPVNQTVLDFTYGVPQELTESRNDARAVVIVPMDAWLIQFSAWCDHAQALANLPNTRVVLLAPQAPDPQFRDLWTARLNPGLQSTVNGDGKGMTILQKAPEGRNTLVRDLRALLPEVCTRPPVRLPNGRPILSVPRGRGRDT